MESAEDLGGGGWFATERSTLSPDDDLHPRHHRKEKVSRKLAEIDLWSLAVWRDTEKLERGELAASQSDLAERWDWTTSRVRRFLKRLEDHGEIERESMDGSDGTRIRIVRYDDVQPGSGAVRGRQGGTDTVTDTPQRHTKDQETPGRSRGYRHPPPTQSPTPHLSIRSEEINRVHTREEKQNGGGTEVQDRARDAWKKIQTHREEDRLDDLDLPAPETEALRKVGGTEAVEDAARRPKGEIQLRTHFFRALRELLTPEEVT